MSEYDKDPLLYNLKRDEIIRQLNREKWRNMRYSHPSLSGLSESEANTLRKVQSRYDRQYNLYSKDFNTESQKNIQTLEGLGFIRIEQDGRIIPSFIFQEHGKPIFKKRETINVGNKEFNI